MDAQRPVERRLVAQHPQGLDIGLAAGVFDRGVEAADGLAADVHLAADGILDRRVGRVERRDPVGVALGDGVEVGVDGLGDLLGARHGPERYTDAPSASARSSALVTGRSHTRPRQIGARRRLRPVPADPAAGPSPSGRRPHGAPVPAGAPRQPAAAIRHRRRRPPPAAAPHGGLGHREANARPTAAPCPAAASAPAVPRPPPAVPRRPFAVDQVRDRQQRLGDQRRPDGVAPSNGSAGRTINRSASSALSNQRPGRSGSAKCACAKPTSSAAVASQEASDGQLVQREQAGGQRGA